MSLSHVQLQLKDLYPNLNCNIPFALPLSIPLLGKMMRVCKSWRDIAEANCQLIGDDLGLIFSRHMRRYGDFKIKRPALQSNKLHPRILALHQKCYPRLDVFRGVHQNHKTLPAPSKMAQLMDFYVQTTAKAYDQFKSHKTVPPEIIGRLDISDIKLLKQVNDATDCRRFWKWLCIRRELPFNFQIDSLESLLAIQTKLVQWCKLNSKALLKVEYLDLQQGDMNALPDVFEHLPNLATLELRMNPIDRLPDSIGKLTELRYLGLIESRLTKLPNSMQTLTLLSELHLSCSDLNELPECIDDLKNLTELNIENNHLTTLPKSIGNLHQLETLRLQWNKLENIHKTIGKLKNLKTLNLSHNNLDALPSTIKNLENLESLELAGNKLTLMDLPAGFWLLSKMKHLTVNDKYSSNFWDHKIAYFNTLKSSVQEFKLF